MLKIYLTNLGKYNEGFLIGEWVSLPATEEEIEYIKERIGVSDEPDENGNYYEEWFITDYETDIPTFKVQEYSDIDELNDIAEKWKNLYDGEKEVVGAMIENGYTFEEAIEGRDDCIVYCDCYNMTDVAMEYCDQCSILNDIPEHLQCYFNYEAFGHDMSYEGSFIFTDQGNCVQIL